MKWTELEFKEFVTLQRGFDLPQIQMQEGEVPVLGSNRIIGYHNEAKVRPPGVVTGRSGTLGVVQYTDVPYWPHNTALWVRDFKQNDPRFVYYKLWTLNLDGFSSGASVPTLNRNNLDNLKVVIPSLDLQHRIASILSTYDDLIENNLRRIKLLEESARMLYKEWFVDLRFPGYEHTRIIKGVPEGWGKKKLGDSVTLNYGKSLRKEERVEGAYSVYGSSGRVGTHTEALVKGPGIIVGRKGNVGSVFWSQKEYWPIDTVYYIDGNQSSFFLYHNLKLQNLISSHGAVPGLNREFAYSLPALAPRKNILEEFEQTATSFFSQIFTLKEMNEELRQARDILLPKLMSGEVEVR